VNTLILHVTTPLCRIGKSRGIARTKCDGTRAETIFGLSVKRTSPFKSAGFQFSRLLAVEECGSADSDCIDRVPTYKARLLAIHSIPIFPLHIPSRASPCAIRFRTRCNYTVLPVFHTCSLRQCSYLERRQKEAYYLKMTSTAECQLLCLHTVGFSTNEI